MITEPALPPSRRAALGDRPARVRAPLVERAVVHAVAVHADPLECHQRDRRRDVAATCGDQLRRRVRRVDARIARKPGDRRQGRPQTCGAVNELLIREATSPWDVTGIRRTVLAEEKVAGPGVDERRAFAAGLLDFDERAPAACPPRDAITSADMPARRNAHTVTATLPAPAAAMRRIAAIPASGISRLTRQSIRGTPRPKTVRNSAA
jgi:hypothetical protein